MSKNLYLAEIRAKLGITQAKLAELLDVDRKYVSMIETGNKPLSGKMSKKLASLLSGDIHIQGGTVNSVIGHGGTVGTPPQADADFQEEIRKRLSNIERVLVDLIAKSSNGD